MHQLPLIGMIVGLLVGLGGLGWGLAGRAADAKSVLGDTLQIYGMGTDVGGVTYEVETDDDAPNPDASVIESELMRRAVAAAGKVAEDRGLLPKVVRKLEAADVPLRSQEALFIYLAGALLVSAAVIALSAPVYLLGVLGAAVVFALPPMVLSVVAARRRKKFAGGLSDTLNLFAPALRAGYSLGQAVEAVAKDSSGSMGKELQRVVAEVRLGRNLEAALLEAGNRMESVDFQWVVLAIKVQREVGGNLAELLDTVADTILQRQRLKREVKTLTAEARASAVILAVMTPVLGLIITKVNPDYMLPFVKSSLGRMMLGGALVWTLVGFVWMKKVTDVDV